MVFAGVSTIGIGCATSGVGDSTGVARVPSTGPLVVSTSAVTTGGSAAWTLFRFLHRGLEVKYTCEFIE